MKLSERISIVKTASKRLGRGYGSGKGGHTASRGQKGQKSRSKLPIWFEGGQLPLIRRLPFQRGKLRFKSLKQPNLPIRLSLLNQFKDGSKVSVKALLDAGIISERDVRLYAIKVVGHGKLDKALTVSVPTTRQAEAIIVKTGGSVESGQDK